MLPRQLLINVMFCLGKLTVHALSFNFMGRSLLLVDLFGGGLNYTGQVLDQLLVLRQVGA